ncbi:MAG: hypothetical protein HRU36_02070 [Rickettsiales bacterium]|nr:hypothetical protein [Rickettsiales bacterium]
MSFYKDAKELCFSTVNKVVDTGYVALAGGTVECAAGAAIAMHIHTNAPLKHAGDFSHYGILAGLQAMQHNLGSIFFQPAAKAINGCIIGAGIGIATAVAIKSYNDQTSDPIPEQDIAGDTKSEFHQDQHDIA